jgi:hypothetical protein
MARAVIAIAELAAIVLVFVLTIGGTMVGDGIEAWLLPSRARGNGVLIGAGVGFLISVFITSFFFALSQIERNTRRIADLLEKSGR